MKGKFLILMIFVLGCSKHKEHHSKLSDSHRLSPKVQVLVDSLSKVKYISLGEKQSRRYDSLIKYASLNDLIFLTNHQDPYIRCFSFNALAEKKNPSLKDIFMEHKDDNNGVTIGLGDQIGEWTVAQYMLNLLNPRFKSVKIFSIAEFNKLNDYVDLNKTEIIKETKINWNDTIEKLKHLDLAYAQNYYWADSDDKDFNLKRRLIKKKIPFQKFEENIVATAYFEINGCHAHFPNIERKGDTIILKDQLLHKNTCDEDFRVIHKINFLIYNGSVSNIKTVLAE